MSHHPISCFLSLILFSLASFAQDVTPPVFDPVEPELVIECSDLDNITVTATDNSGDPVTITFSDMEFSGGCVPNILRTYIAEDSSGNTSTEYQLFITEDTTPPIFMGAGEDMELSCQDEIPQIPDVIAYDECQAEELEGVLFEETTEETLCQTVITWTWTATDFCGNTGSHTKTITIVDDQAPEFNEEPEDLFAFCTDGFPEVPELTASDNCNEVTISYEEELIEGGTDLGEAAYCTALDVNFNNTAFSLLLIESPAQEEYSTSDLVFMQMPDLGDGATAVLSGNIYGVDNPNAGWYVHMEFDNGMDWDSWSSQDFPTSYKDDFDNVGDNYLDWTYYLLNATNSQMIGLGDYEGSELDLNHIPANYYFGFQLGDAANNFSSNYGFGGWFHVEGTFMDSSSSDPDIVNGIEISHAGDLYIDLNCCPVESLVRTWTATDACDNSSSVDQVITLIDVTAPEFTFVPADLLLECGEEIPEELAEATDACSEVTVMFEDEIIETDCSGEYSIYRTFTATDECGHSASVTQMITVIDTTAPSIIDAPDNLIIDCEAEVPEPADITAIDACDNDIEISFFEEVIGETGPEDALAHCQALTPAGMDNSWSFIMFDEVMGNLTATTEEASFTQFEDEIEGHTAVLEATLVSTQNSEAGWELTMQLVNGMNWEEWSNQEFPTSFKDDLETAEDHYQDWIYFILESGTLNGWGDYEGTSIELNHAPSNNYFGFQLGIQGANVNTEYGIGGWAQYSGTIYDENTQSIVTLEGAGDLAFDLDCCPAESVMRTWEFTDCAGNTSTHTQTITFDHIEPDAPVVQDVEEEESLAGLFLDEIIEVSASPNPMGQESLVKVDSKIDVSSKIELYSTQGILVKELFDGEVSKDEILEVILERGDLPHGIYIIRLSTLNGTVSYRIMMGEEN